jgi:hypothetical protein
MAAVPVMLLCCSCKELKPTTECNVWEQQGRSYSRCKRCASWPGRLSRCLAQMTGEEAKTIKALTGEDKRQFMLSHLEHHGEQLKKAVETYGSHETRTVETEGFKAVGTMVEEKELELLYKDDPERLANTKANAAQMTCPIIKRTMYEVTTYTSVKGNTVTSDEMTGQSMGSKDSLRGAKKLKVEASPGAPAKALMPLKDSVFTRVQKLSDKLGHAMAEAVQIVERCSVPEMADWVPRAHIKHCMLTHKKAECEQAALSLLLEEGWKGEPKPIIDKAAVALSYLLDDVNRLNLFFKEVPHDTDEEQEGEDDAEGKASPAPESKASPAEAPVSSATVPMAGVAPAAPVPQIGSKVRLNTKGPVE